MIRGHKRIAADVALLREAAGEYDEFGAGLSWRESAHCRRKARRLRELADFIEERGLVLAVEGMSVGSYAQDIYALMDNEGEA